MEESPRPRMVWIAELLADPRTERWLEALFARNGIREWGFSTFGPRLELAVAPGRVEQALPLLRSEAERRGCWGMFRFVERSGRRYQPVAEFERGQGAEDREARIRAVLCGTGLDAIVESHPWRVGVYVTPASTPAVLAAL